MAKRLSFREFDTKLKAGSLTSAEYRAHLEIDPTTSTVRVRLKPGALLDSPPPGYDVDHEVYLSERAQEERELATRELLGLKRVLAEGDSWFNLPMAIRPKAIADRIKSNRRVNLKNIAKWGHTLAKILGAKEYLTEITRFKPDCLIFSGGGNDLQNSLERHELVLPYDSGRPLNECISPAGLSLLETIANSYRTLLNELAVYHPTLPSICYAYDYPRPTYKGGEYLGQYFKAMNYPVNTWDEVAQLIVNKLKAAVEPVVTAFPNARFMDCIGVTKDHKFFDDFHPGEDGFKALARAFEEKLGVAPPLRSKAKTGRHAVRGRSHSRSRRRSTRSAKNLPTRRATQSKRGRIPRKK